MITITNEQIAILEQELDEPWQAIGASMQTSNPAFILKAINDEINANGNDWQYELNAKGKLLQQMYEEIYAANCSDDRPLRLG